MKEICGKCRFFDLDGLNKDKFGPCCLNPPQIVGLDPAHYTFVRPMALHDSPMCRFGLIVIRDGLIGIQDEA